MVELVIRDLGDGLVMRRATRADADALAQFNGTIHRSPDTAPINPGIIALVQDMTARPHPSMEASDFTIVEDMSCKQIVSSLCLIPQTWSYAGIPFGVGRPELVGTNPAYRNRGLVRAQFEEIHAWSKERGHLLQSITGIPYYYRQFGYEYAISLGGGRTCTIFEVPSLKEGTSEPFVVRSANVNDIPFLQDTYAFACQRSLVACVRDEVVWRYDIEGRSPSSECCTRIGIIEATDGRAVGYVSHATRAQNGGVGVSQFELARSTSWLEVTPSVLRYFRAFGEQDIAARGEGTFDHIGFWLGVEHPVYQVLWRLPNVNPPYAWYIRVPDLQAFITNISPVLQQRLAASTIPGYTGEIKLSFFRSGLTLCLDKGKLAKVDSWQPSARDWGMARFPGLTFLQLLFGYRSLDELQYAFPDCSAGNDETRLLISTLFPRMNSAIWGLE